MTKFNKSLVAANLLISVCREIVTDRFVEQSSARDAEIQGKDIYQFRDFLKQSLVLQEAILESLLTSGYHLCSFHRKNIMFAVHLEDINLKMVFML